MDDDDVVDDDDLFDMLNVERVIHRTDGSAG